jgi:hypothetical protein
LKAQYSAEGEAQGENSFLRRCLLNTYTGEGKKAGVIGYNSHFRAVTARLIKNSLLKLSLYIRIFFISGI